MVSMTTAETDDPYAGVTPTAEMVRADPEYWLAGPGHERAEATECPHEYFLTDSCPGCDADEEAARPTFAGEQSASGDPDAEDVRAFLLATCPPEVLYRLAARVEREGQRLLQAAVQGEVPSAFEIAEHQRRRAAVWARLAAVDPKFAPVADAAAVDWRRAEVHHVTAVVINAAQ